MSVLEVTQITEPFVCFIVIVSYLALYLLHLLQLDSFENLQRLCSFRNAFVGVFFVMCSFRFEFILSIFTTAFPPIGRIFYSRKVPCQSTRALLISFANVTRLSSTSINSSTLTWSQHDSCWNRVSHSLPMPKWTLLFSVVLNPQSWKQCLIAPSDTLPIHLQPVNSHWNI